MKKMHFLFYKKYIINIYFISYQQKSMENFSYSRTMTEKPLHARTLL